MNAELERLRLDVLNWGQWCRRFGYALLASAALWAISTYFVIVDSLHGVIRPHIYGAADVALFACTVVMIALGFYATVRGTRAIRLFRAAQHEWFTKQANAHMQLLTLLEQHVNPPSNYAFSPELFEKDLTFALQTDLRIRSESQGVEAAWKMLIGLAEATSVTSPLAKFYGQAIAVNALLGFVAREGRAFMRDGYGRELPRHDCAMRSETAQKMVQIVRMMKGPWQFVGNTDTHFSIAIRYCPFCGIDLEKKHD